MSSKKKSNGCSSVRCVSEAARKCGCSIERFFAYAALAENEKRRARNAKLLFGDDAEAFMEAIKADVKRFLLFKMQGVVADPRYRIPRYVIAYAEGVMTSGAPRSRKEHEKKYARPLRPSLAMRA